MKYADRIKYIESLPKFNGNYIDSNYFYFYRTRCKHDSGFSWIYVYTDDYLVGACDIVYLNNSVKFDFTMGGVMRVFSNNRKRLRIYSFV